MDSTMMRARLGVERRLLPKMRARASRQADDMEGGTTLSRSPWMSTCGNPRGRNSSGDVCARRAGSESRPSSADTAPLLKLDPSRRQHGGSDTAASPIKPRGHIRKGRRSAATGFSDAALFDIRGSQSLLSQRGAGVTEMRRAVAGSPEAAMQHDHDVTVRAHRYGKRNSVTEIYVLVLCSRSACVAHVSAGSQGG